MQMAYSLVLKHAIQMRLEHRKFPTTSYCEIMRRRSKYKKFPLTILVLEKYMVVVLVLQTYASQLSLPKNSLMI
jgi:hypothetical protein